MLRQFLRSDGCDMKDESEKFACPQMAKAVLKEFGRSAKTVTVEMRACDDVPKFVEMLQNAHRRTAESTLRFGPSVMPVR